MFLDHTYCVRVCVQNGKLSDAQGTIVAMKREMNQMNNDLMLLLLRQSTFDDKRPAASSATLNNKSIEPASGGDYKASYNSFSLSYCVIECCFDVILNCV